MHRELHEESLELYQKAIEKVNKVSKDLKEEDRQDILERFQRMQVWIELHQEEYEAYIRLMIHRKKPQMENKEAGSGSIEAAGGEGTGYQDRKGFRLLSLLTEPY